MGTIARTAVAATVLAALLAGGATGLGLHAWRPDPFATASVRDTSADPGRGADDSPSASPNASGSPSASPSPSTTPSQTPSKSPTKSPSASGGETGPAFTRAALLRTYDFTDHGWAVATVTKAYTSLPDTPIMPCTTITMGDTGVAEGYAASYASQHTEAFELVARYGDETGAKRAFSQALNMIANCDSTAYDPKVLITGFAHTADASGVDDIRWFNTRASATNDTLGVIGVVRAQDRIAILEMSSSSSDPDNTHKGGTTDVAGLLGTAGKHLV